MSDTWLPPVQEDGPGILLLDPEGRVRFVNESARSLLRLHSPVDAGTEGATELQDTLSRLQEPEHRGRARLLLGLRHDREDGSERRVDVEIRPLESGETTVLFHPATQEQDAPSPLSTDLHRMAFQHAEAGMALVEAGANSGSSIATPHSCVSWASTGIPSPGRRFQRSSRARARWRHSCGSPPRCGSEPWFSYIPVRGATCSV